MSTAIESILSQRINLPEIHRLVSWAADDDKRDRLLELAHSTDTRTSVNALWTISHFPSRENMWLQSHQDDFIDMLLTETVTAKKRILLQILKVQDFDGDNIRTDFLDFCLSKINSECEPYAIRAFSIYCAFRMCRHYPELLAELQEHLDMLSLQPLSPGLRSALRQTKTHIRSVNRIKSRTQ